MSTDQTRDRLVKLIYDGIDPFGLDSDSLAKSAASIVLDRNVVIDRDDLPKVVEDGEDFRVDGVYLNARVPAAMPRRLALRYLAVVEHLKAKEAQEAEQAAEARLAARRDELVDELYQQVISCNPLPAGYSSRSPVVQAAIDRIRELEDKLAEAQEAQA